MPLSKHSERTQTGARCLRRSAFAKISLVFFSPFPAHHRSRLRAGGGLEAHPWCGVVCKAPQMLLAEGGCENSPAVNPHSCSKRGAGINCTRTGFIGEVACTSLVFNFQFSFNCPFLGGFKDFHNSFQPAHRGANPAALLPPPLPSYGFPGAEMVLCRARERKIPTSSQALSRAVREVTCVQPGVLFVRMGPRLPHRTVYTSRAARKAR